MKKVVFRVAVAALMAKCFAMSLLLELIFNISKHETIALIFCVEPDSRRMQVGWLHELVWTFEC